MPFEGVPIPKNQTDSFLAKEESKTLLSVDDIESKKEQLSGVVRHKIAEINLVPETAISSQVRGRFESLLEELASVSGQDIESAAHDLQGLEARIQTLGDDTEASIPETVASPAAATAPVLEKVVENNIQTIEIRNEALSAHIIEMKKAKEAFFAQFTERSIIGNTSESVAKRKALKYARIDYKKWEQIVHELLRLRDDQVQRRRDLTLLAQSHYSSFVKNANILEAGSIPFVTYTIPKAPNRDAYPAELLKQEIPEVLVSEASQDNISETVSNRLLEIDQQLNTLLSLDNESKRELAEMVSHVRRVQAEYDELADGKFYPELYVQKTLVLQKSMQKLEETLAAVMPISKEQSEVIDDTSTLVLGAKERLADDSQFEAVLRDLDVYDLDESDENLVRVCKENYLKFQSLGDAVRAGSYLHNLQEIINRKETQKHDGAPHGEIVGRLAVISEALKAMEIVDKESAAAISAETQNVERLLSEVKANPEKEKVLQQTYQSLEDLYKNAMTPDEGLSSMATVGATPVILEEPNSEASVTTSGAKSSTPRIVGVASRELVPNGVLERKNRIWDNLKRRLNTVAKTAVVAIAAMYTTNNETDKNVNAFYGSNIPVSASSISGIGPDAAWATQDPMNLETARLAEEGKVEVVPPIARVMEEETSPAVSPDQSDSNNTAQVLSDTGAAVESIEANAIKPTHLYQVEKGEPSTYVDSLITRVLGTVDYKGLPDTLVDQIKAETRAHFLNSPDMIREAGIDSGDPSIVFDKQQIDLSKFVWYVEGEVAKKVKALTDPLAMNQVVEKGDTLTAVAAEAYAPELSEQGISPEGQQQIVAEAVTAQTATPEGLQALGLKDADLIKPGDVIRIGEMAEEVATATEDYLSQENLSDQADVSEEIAKSTPLTPENYPGGTLSFSRDYNTLLDKLGISVTNPSWVDSMFFSNAPSNRAILDMTVGELTKIMLGDTNSIINELAARNISTETAQSVYDIVRAGRVTGVIDPTLNAAQTIASVLQMKTMSDARNRDT